MMKASDVASAVSLVLQGFLRSNDEGDLPKPQQDRLLAQAIDAARQECDDWAENLATNNAALEIDDITVVLLEGDGGAVSRSPYNLVSAAVALASEAVDLAGPSIITDLVTRIQEVRS